MQRLYSPSGAASDNLGLSRTEVIRGSKDTNRLWGRGYFFLTNACCAGNPPERYKYTEYFFSKPRNTHLEWFSTFSKVWKPSPRSYHPPPPPPPPKKKSLENIENPSHRLCPVALEIKLRIARVFFSRNESLLGNICHLLQNGPCHCGHR